MLHLKKKKEEKTQILSNNKNKGKVANSRPHVLTERRVTCHLKNYITASFFAHLSVLLGEDLLVCLDRKHGGENNDTRDRAALQVALEDI